MKDANRWIFRADAVRRYTQSREESVLPRFVSPRTFTYLWILLGLLGVSGFVAWCDAGASVCLWARRCC